jgi:thiamine-phosphate pyrophosphorylase
MVQLREKHASPREFFESALEAVKTARRLGVLLIVNDRVDIAIAAGADGVHLGQDDIPPARARALMGESRIIGFSTHTLEQATAAEFLPVDYIAIGPIYETTTRDNPHEVVGLEMLDEVRHAVSKPVVAIGGITIERAKAVINAGADGVAVISDLYCTDNLSKRVGEYLQLLGQP